METIKRELKVAFSLGSQPLAFRITKWVVIVAVLYFTRNYIQPLLLLGILFVPALALHFYYRHKTKGWTQSYGMWHYEKVFGTNPDGG